MSATSFVDVRHVFVDLASPTSILARLTGRTSQPYSVLRDVSFQLTAGQQVVIFGGAGSGKSTLLRTLAGTLAPSRGKIFINGKPPHEAPGMAAGYVSVEESEPGGDTVHAALHAYGISHSLSGVPARVGAIAEQVGLTGMLTKKVEILSTTERLRLNIARAVMSPAPLLLLDDVVDQLGALAVKQLLDGVLRDRTVLLATRSIIDAEALNMPLMLLHNGTIAHFGDRDALALAAGCERTVYAWVESLRYDVLRSLRRLPGIVEVRLIPTDQFEGQKLQIVVKSSRYLPTLYDHISQAALIKIEEHPVTLSEILRAL
ncbi:MAG: ATP-binding cassette domain-containing protein [Candidatus Andersenbacteria bacterium]|nr:ATP-binding cassette domain-containing protein [Candidatus Andersenbacteria bacterium]MBI3250394.1 ATP-binding cassette domain-containing protein [Candidatus Andersenbacteria bacterium]